MIELQTLILIVVVVSFVFITAIAAALCWLCRIFRKDRFIVQNYNYNRSVALCPELANQCEVDEEQARLTSSCSIILLPPSIGNSVPDDEVQQNTTNTVIALARSSTREENVPERLDSLRCHQRNSLSGPMFVEHVTEGQLQSNRRSARMSYQPCPLEDVIVLDGTEPPPPYDDGG
ncbi:uncharacterized protein LOC143230364 [Tachypleus tridentatus]|uniref:uncharacterized protein LOC143230364 n=1 Tax=Tachypleus tridentatus TaxID=6853 RepID=UPI003FD1D42B